VNLGGSYLGSISNPSGLVSAHTTRLDSFWLQQSLFNNKLTIKAGQFAGMDFYGIMYYGGNFLIEPIDYGFGPRFQDFESFDPASGPAAEIKIAPIHQVYFKVAVTSGNHDPYGDDTNGFHFKAKNHAVIDDEVGFVYDQPDGKNMKDKYYPGLYQFGSTWNGDHFADFATGALRPNGNYQVYFMANQAFYRPIAHSNQGLDFHFGLDVSPSNVNFVDRQVTFALMYTGLIPKRGKDSLNFGLVHSKISDVFNTGFETALTSEKAYEINYKTQITPWLVWQPVVQIYQTLGANPQNGTGVAAGFRTLVTF
jgi:porin